MRGQVHCRRGLAVALLVAAVAAAPRGARASPEDIFGYGTRAGAMGATGAADAEGYEAVYGNPALLSLTRDRRLTVGLVGAVLDLRADGERLSYGPLRGGLIGATLPIPFGGALTDRVTLGLGFFTPFDVVVRGRILDPETPQFLLADRTQSVAVQAGLGVDLGHGLRLGGGFAALAALSGSVQVATDTSGRVGTVVENSLLASYGPIVGVSYEAGAYRVGATFRGELVGRFDVVIQVEDLGQIEVPPLHISGVAQYDPWQVALEAARVDGPWRVSVGVTYKRWSEYPGALEATVRCPLVDPKTGEPYAALCSARTPDPPGYTDTVVPRAGAERALTPAPGVTMLLRGGVFVEPTPAPEQSGASNLYDSTRVALTLGYGLLLDHPLPRVSLDMFAQLHGLVPRDHEKAAGEAGGGASVVQTGGLILAGGATAGVVF